MARQSYTDDELFTAGMTAARRNADLHYGNYGEPDVYATIWHKELNLLDTLLIRTRDYIGIDLCLWDKAASAYVENYLPALYIYGVNEDTYKAALALNPTPFVIEYWPNSNIMIIAHPTTQLCEGCQDWIEPGQEYVLGEDNCYYHHPDCWHEHTAGEPDGYHEGNRMTMPSI